ncbi:MAG TPA: hypothetical protein VMT73_14180 [Anaerolineales bacterium]|nr:hypothetical protein [Anaerolineales bacterium]
MPESSKIILIGNDTTLAYLIGRYAERSDHDVIILQNIPAIEEVRGLRPLAILFSSLDGLEAAQTLVAGLAAHDILILVCSSLSDEVRARELGADHYLPHPLTYDSFLTALTTVKTSAKRDKTSNL